MLRVRRHSEDTYAVEHRGPRSVEEAVAKLDEIARLCPAHFHVTGLDGRRPLERGRQWSVRVWFQRDRRAPPDAEFEIADG